MQSVASNTDSVVQPIEQKQEAFRKHDLLISPSERRQHVSAQNARYAYYPVQAKSGQHYQQQRFQHQSQLAQQSGQLLHQQQIYQPKSPASHLDAASSGYSALNHGGKQAPLHPPANTHNTNYNHVAPLSAYRPNVYGLAGASGHHGQAGPPSGAPGTYGSSVSNGAHGALGAASNSPSHGHGHAAPYLHEKSKEQIEEEAAIYVKSKDEYAEDRPQIILDLRPRVSISHANATHPEPKTHPRDKNPFFKLQLNPEIVNVSSTTPEYDDDYHVGRNKYKHGYGHGYGHDYTPKRSTTARPSVTTERVSITTTEKSDDYDYEDTTTTAATTTTDASDSTTTRASRDDDDDEDADTTTESSGGSTSTTIATTTLAEADDDDEDAPVTLSTTTKSSGIGSLTTLSTTTTQASSSSSSTTSSSSSGDDDDDENEVTTKKSASAAMSMTDDSDDDNDDDVEITTKNAIETSTSTTEAANDDDEDENSLTNLMKKLTTTGAPGSATTITTKAPMRTPSSTSTTTKRPSSFVPTPGRVSGTDESAEEDEEEHVSPLTTDRTTIRPPRITTKASTTTTTTASSTEEPEEEDDEDEIDALRKKLTTVRPAAMATTAFSRAAVRMPSTRLIAGSGSVRRAVGPTVRTRTIRSTTEHSEKDLEDEDDAEEEGGEASTARSNVAIAKEDEEDDQSTEEVVTAKLKGRNQIDKAMALRFPDTQANVTSSGDPVGNGELLSLLREMSDNMADLMRLQASTTNCPEVVINGQKYRIDGGRVIAVSPSPMQEQDIASKPTEEESNGNKLNESKSGDDASSQEQDLNNQTKKETDDDEDGSDEEDEESSNKSVSKSALINRKQEQKIKNSDNDQVTRTQEVSVSTSKSKTGQSIAIKQTNRSSGKSIQMAKPDSKAKKSKGQGQQRMSVSSFETFNERTQSLVQSSTESSFSFGDLDQVTTDQEPAISVTTEAPSATSSPITAKSDDEDEEEGGDDADKENKTPVQTESSIKDADRTQQPASPALADDDDEEEDDRFILNARKKEVPKPIALKVKAEGEMSKEKMATKVRPLDGNRKKAERSSEDKKSIDSGRSHRKDVSPITVQPNQIMKSGADSEPIIVVLLPSDEEARA